jgi:hypothetical protein
MLLVHHGRAFFVAGPSFNSLTTPRIEHSGIRDSIEFAGLDMLSPANANRETNDRIPDAGQ